MMTAEVSVSTRTVAAVQRVPLIRPDLPSFEEVAGPIREILENGQVTNFGAYVRRLEEAASALLGTHVVAVSSGTLGLLFTLQALGLKPGQRVIVPSFTFMATAQAIRYAGGVPTFAEIGEDFTLDPGDLAMLLATHDDVGAVVPVHTFGLPCQVDALEQIVSDAARQAGRPIPIVYDAAHAFGSSIEGRPVGMFGSAEVFSLSVTKALVSVEGGMVASHNLGLIQRLRKMRNYGIEADYNAFWPGLNGKMSEFHAIVGLATIRRLPALIVERQRKARAYANRVERATSFRLTPWPATVVHTFKDFTVVVPAALEGCRDRVIEFLAARGIETRAYFSPPVHQQASFRGLADRPLCRTEHLSQRVITLPFYTSIGEDEMDYVVAALADAEAELACR
ncbi:MAG: DegT/DnrJ/EryC1/StrS family aminotransferase [Chloroflexi bacterium]|nr:DegT/DnrJ/EryC1/StrS family aminotransferase [Chloroflexota bacterium]